ncbi:MAG TPA: ABC transporter substrate-binding protein [Dongiaceae bacterium]|nr:ABC transporter substrate-binding protein [Dongiaceae bacterium]
MTILSRLGAALALACAVFAVHPAPASAYTLTVVDGIDVKDWDPAVAYGHESYVLNNIYDPLTRYNTKERKLEPALATSWSVSDDGLAWTFKLRPNVKFHSGAPMTAGAIKTMLDRNIKMNQGAQYLWGGATVTAPDDSTLVIKTKDPLPIDLVSSASYAAMIYSPAAAAAGNAWFQKGNADGTGPYKLAQWIPNQQIVLERNRDYWGGWKGDEADRIIIRIVSEVSTQLQMLRSGEADMTFATIPFDMIGTLTKDPNIKVEVVDSWQYLPAPINVQLAPTNNLKFRQALTHIMDYDTVAKQIYAGLASVPEGPTPMALPGAIKYDMPKFDLDLAKKLLAESGVPQDQWKITWVAYGGVDVLKNVALLFQADAAKVGVKVEIVQGEWGVMWDKQKHLETSFNVFPFRNWPDYATIQPESLFETQKENVSFNLSHYSDPEVDKLIEEGTKLEAVDKKACYKAWQQAYQKVIDDAAAMFIADTKRIIAHRANLEGVTTDPAYETVFFRFLHRAAS